MNHVTEYTDYGYIIQYGFGGCDNCAKTDNATTREVEYVDKDGTHTLCEDCYDDRYKELVTVDQGSPEPGVPLPTKEDLFLAEFDLTTAGMERNRHELLHDRAVKRLLNGDITVQQYDTGYDQYMEVVAEAMEAQRKVNILKAQLGIGEGE